MNFFKQILAELKLSIRSKFISISCILMILGICVGVPLFMFVLDSYYSGTYRGHYDTVVIDGVEYEKNSRMTWTYSEIVYNLDNLRESTSNDVEIEYAIEMLELKKEFFEKNIPLISEYSYKEDVSITIEDNLIINYILTNDELDENTLAKALSLANIYLYEYDGEIDEVLDLSSSEKAALLTENQELMEKFDELVMEDDFSIYIDIMKSDYQEQLSDLNAQILALEEELVDNPTAENYISEQISDIEYSINDITEVRLPTLDYRLENNITPSDLGWENVAISGVENNKSSVLYYEKNLKIEAEFYEDQNLLSQYDTYEEYSKDIETKIQKAQLDMLIAQKSLDSGKPDMSFVNDGARKNLHDTFSLLVFVLLFAVLVGGCAIAPDFQNGTVRLLMIRPRTREKVLFSKYFGGLLLTFIAFLIIFIINFFVTGFTYGFDDYFYMNYTATGEINFFALMISEMMISFTSVIFMYSLAFAISAIVKSVAISIIVPFLLMFGNSIMVAFLTSQEIIEWLAYTPMPYISMHDFFFEGNALEYLIGRGFPATIETGVVVLFVCSLAVTFLSLYVYKKRDITN